MVWWPLDKSELPIAQNIGDTVHPTLPERYEILCEKYSLFPRGCYGLRQNDQIVGYGISHPWIIGTTPIVDEFLGQLPKHCDCFHLHDIGILPEYRGQYASEFYITLMKGLARTMGYHYMTAVSVYGTHTYWGRFGFKVVEKDGLESYGPTAKYLVCKL
jgi:hypothetical protein